MQIYNFILIIPLFIKLYNDLTIFQQSHYSLVDYIKYINKFWVLYIIYFLISIMAFYANSSNVSIVLYLYLTLFEIISFKKFKVPLKSTIRIIRGCFLSSIIISIIIIFPFLYFTFDYILIISFLLSILIEKVINYKYISSSVNKLKNYQGNIIAITGSFGKTTCKYFISQILDSKKVFITKDSFNTPIGISLAINNIIPEIYNHIVLEFGATKVSDIKYLSNLYKPNIGIVTSIGYMHLNSFKTIDNIIREKMSLIENLDNNGLVILNYDNKFIREYCIINKVKVISYGFKYGDLKICRENNYLKIYYLGLFICKIYYNNLNDNEILDMMPSIILALYYQINLKEIQDKVINITKPKARLELINNEKITIINDSFNSNLDGALDALEKLRCLKGKKYLITPGFVDNDIILEELYKRYVLGIKKSSDIVFIIHSKSGDLLYKMLNGDNVYLVDSFKEAYKLFNLDKSQYKSLLIENDLPDIYERNMI